ncbi:MAG: glutamate-5-semialdehyde dehydrogenase [Clostridiales bacterium]|nr:glutamate-5-semialdehyde dehydrogenase [Clostridiales bacterium]
MGKILEIARRAKKISYNLSTLSSSTKDGALKEMAKALIDNSEFIIEENNLDVETAEALGKDRAFIDRLRLDTARIEQMADGLLTIEALPDPIGSTISTWKRPNGLEIGQRRVPLGVVGIIYEARPNVTADVVGLCLKTGNAAILRGGSDAIHSNKAVIKVLWDAAKKVGIPHGAFSLIEDTSRKSAETLMKLNGLVDVLIPRGGAGLIQNVVENATIPIIETGVGNCHIYIDGQCDISMALEISMNAKVQRPGVCNAIETLLIDEKISNTFLPQIVESLEAEDVEIRGCEKAKKIVGCIEASEEDWHAEYLDYILAIKVVDGIEEAIAHINEYGTGHSEGIVTSNYFNAQKFLTEVDAAAVYVNASTRFTDGYEYGFGAEMGISTQKLHARGPMGLEALTTIKYVVSGQGQIRK